MCGGTRQGIWGAEMWTNVREFSRVEKFPQSGGKERANLDGVREGVREGVRGGIRRHRASCAMILRGVSASHIAPRRPSSAG